MKNYDKRIEAIRQAGYDIGKTERSTHLFTTEECYTVVLPNGNTHGGFKRLGDAIKRAEELIHLG